MGSQLSFFMFFCFCFYLYIYIYIWHVLQGFQDGKDGYVNVKHYLRAYSQFSNSRIPYRTAFNHHAWLLVFSFSQNLGFDLAGDSSLARVVS